MLQWHIVLMGKGWSAEHALDLLFLHLIHFVDKVEVHDFVGTYRLFSCGTNREGESHIVEWNENEGTVRRTYRGFHKRSLGVVQFDTTKNKFLAVGDDYSIKLWDMDNNNLLTTIGAEGGLPVRSLLELSHTIFHHLLFLWLMVLYLYHYHIFYRIQSYGLS